MFISSLPLSSILSSGDVAIAIEFSSDEIVGMSTAYKGFNVSTLDNKTVNLMDGELPHKNDQRLEVKYADVVFRDFITNVTFFNPYDSATGFWTYGFVFRDNDINGHFRLYVSSNQEWTLSRLYLSNDEAQFAQISNGTLPNLDTSANASNDLMLITMGEIGYFFVNNMFISSLPLSSILSSGDVAIAIEFSSDEIVGISTTYKRFNVVPIE